MNFKSKHVAITYVLLYICVDSNIYNKVNIPKTVDRVRIYAKCGEWEKMELCWTTIM